MDSRIYQPADSSSVNEGASPESQPSHRRGIWAGAGVGALAALSALLIPNLRVGVSQVGADSPEPVPLAASAERPAVASEP